jgi:hypothetical protein
MLFCGGYLNQLIHFQHLPCAAHPSLISLSLLKDYSELPNKLVNQKTEPILLPSCNKKMRIAILKRNQEVNL